MHACIAQLNNYDDYRDCHHGAGAVGCVDASQARQWLNSAEVQRAIHVSPADASTAGYWQECNSIYDEHGANDTLRYTPNARYIPALYPWLAARCRVLVYDGDNDGGSQRNNEWCLSSLFDVAAKWRPWLYNKSCPGGGYPFGPAYCQPGPQVGGYVIQFDAGEEGRELRYVTVHGAGHMVPQWKPQAAFAMLARFLGSHPA